MKKDKQEIGFSTFSFGGGKNSQQNKIINNAFRDPKELAALNVPLFKLEDEDEIEEYDDFDGQFNGYLKLKE